MILCCNISQDIRMNENKQREILKKHSSQKTIHTGIHPETILCILQSVCCLFPLLLAVLFLQRQWFPVSLSPKKVFVQEEVPSMAETIWHTQNLLTASKPKELTHIAYLSVHVKKVILKLVFKAEICKVLKLEIS